MVSNTTQGLLRTSSWSPTSSKSMSDRKPLVPQPLGRINLLGHHLTPQPASNAVKNILKVLVLKHTSQQHNHHAAAGKTTCINNSSSSFRQRAAAFSIFSTCWSITASPSKRPRIDKYTAMMQSMHPKASQAKSPAESKNSDCTINLDPRHISSNPVTTGKADRATPDSNSFAALLSPEANTMHTLAVDSSKSKVNPSVELAPGSNLSEWVLEPLGELPLLVDSSSSIQCLPDCDPQLSKDVQLVEEPPRPSSTCISSHSRSSRSARRVLVEATQALENKDVGPPLTNPVSKQPKGAKKKIPPPPFSMEWPESGAVSDGLFV
ncbi:hypothetical protein Nepgr_018832 [Nepenthes gracilis]|uniref:Uncharacterized protein n=1 Tax=Nepenthes gracilis TaxID=150966 RepID=A0AAD3SU92_NEPGR|nr:hypothetical protein Nepgr_018832 [Nepenthes gracilis]